MLGPLHLKMSKSDLVEVVAAANPLSAMVMDRCDLEIVDSFGFEPTALTLRDFENQTWKMIVVAGTRTTKQSGTTHHYWSLIEVSESYCDASDSHGPRQQIVSSGILGFAEGKKVAEMFVNGSFPRLGYMARKPESSTLK